MPTWSSVRTRTHAGSVALSGFTQGLGYTLGALGPLAVGVLHELTGGWTVPLLVLTATALAAAGAGAVVAAGLTDAPAVARWILDEQVRLGRRAMVALVAAGGTTAEGGTRFAVEDLLAAGALVDALASLGIDYSSPEAAAACAAFTGLRGAVAHLLTASVSGQERIAAGADAAELAGAGRLGTASDVRVLRAG